MFARWSQYHADKFDLAEVKRLYVHPAHRGHGYAADLMARLEALIVAAGAAGIVLETGLRQPAAIVTYERLGYERIKNFGPYAEEEESVCMGKTLSVD